MTTRSNVPFALSAVVVACASGGSPAPRSGIDRSETAGERAGATPAPSTPSVAPSGTGPTASGPGSSTVAASARPTPPPPPLSSPNAVVERADAGAPADAAPSPPADPETAALRTLALAAQACHAKEVPTVRGKLMLRLTLAADGRVRTAEVSRDATDDALLAQGFVGCVLRASRNQRFPEPRGEDTQLELPLLFDPLQ